MHRNSPSTFARSIAILTIIVAVAAALDLASVQVLYGEAASLLLFGLFCVGCGMYLARSDRERTSGPAAKPASSVATFGGKEKLRRPLVAECAQPRPRHALTIDLEDYFHTEVASRGVSFAEWERQPARIVASTHRLLDVLEENQTRATFFVLGWVAQHYPKLVREIHDRGHEIGCHSLDHRLVCRMTPGQFYDSTRLAKDLIESAIGDAVYGYRAPCFSITPGCEWAFEALVQLGFSYDSSVHPVNHPTYGNPTAPRTAHPVAEGRLLELPIATWKLGGRNLSVGGGAYLRLLPYQYIYRGLRAWEREMKTPAMLYLHPWEIDPYQPPIPLSFGSKIRQTWGTTTMEDKLTRLLRQFNFAPVREAHRPLLTGMAYHPIRASFLPVEAVEQVAG
jgi:polysaccharide deacetylase family protein (PEP-CTERM system associated)